MNHSEPCLCSDCGSAELMLLRDPQALLDRARTHIDDRFAFGILLQAELRMSGVVLFPSRLLPQSAEPKVDPAAVSDDVHEQGFSFRGAR